jgi:hypothetical protein
VPEPQITDTQINVYLDRRGIRYANKGRALLVQAIRYSLDNPGGIKAMNMYAVLAEANNSTASRIERNIRQAIQSSYHTNAAGDQTGNYLEDGGFISNKEFVCRAAYELTFSETSEGREHLAV